MQKVKCTVYEKGFNRDLNMTKLKQTAILKNLLTTRTYMLREHMESVTVGVPRRSAMLP